MPKKIMHVTEALGGGVLHCVALLANLQVETGNEVLIVHSIRSDTPTPEKLNAMFDSRISRRVVNMVTHVGIEDFVSFMALFVELIRERPDIVHLHSAKAGALGRIAARVLGFSKRTIYSPHGFAFLKKDVSRRQARFYILIERILHATGGTLVACSRSEALYARMLLSRQRQEMVENAIDLSQFKEATTRNESDALIVSTSARVAYQKAPWKFSWLAQRFGVGSNVKFVWFGDGNAEAVDQWIDKSSVELSGWMESEDLRRRLSQCDVFLMPSLWEGMPISLIEAQAAGLPAVASRVVGNRDVIIHGVTGFLAKTDMELADYTSRLLEDKPLRDKMAVAARQKALMRFGGQRFLRGYAQIYDGLISTSKRKLKNRVVTAKASTVEK